MRRASSACLLSLPLALAGCLAAHAAAYLFVAPDRHERADLLERTGHGYLSHLPLLAGALAGAALASLACAVLAARRGRSHRPGALPFALVPPVAFSVQEHLERLLEAGAWPTDALAEPTFALGLLLQAPFALLAWILARGLLRAAAALGSVHRPPAPSRRAAAPRSRLPNRAVPRSRALGTRASRAPPARPALAF